MSANFFTSMPGPAAIAMLNRLWDKAASVLTTNVFTKNQSVAPVVLVSGATVAVDASLSNNFRLTLAANATLANPANLTDGMVLNFYFRQDAVGGRTLAYGTKYTFLSGSAPVLSTAANAVDFMSCYYDGPSDKLICSLGKGFA